MVGSGHCHRSRRANGRRFTDTLHADRHFHHDLPPPSSHSNVVDPVVVGTSYNVSEHHHSAPNIDGHHRRYRWSVELDESEPLTNGFLTVNQATGSHPSIAKLFNL